MITTGLQNPHNARTTSEGFPYVDQPKRVLVVEDDARIADLICLHLRDEHFEVVHSADGSEGLFLRAFTIGGARSDAGLGLRIVHRILQLHGRSIDLVNRPGRGATFAFSLESRATAR